MQKARWGLARDEAGTCKHQIIQDLEDYGGDFELYPKSSGKALSDFEQRSVPIGV